MAQEVKVLLICDAEGDRHEATGTHRLQGPDTNPLELDLCDRHLKELRKAIDKWTALGRNANNAHGVQTRRRGRAAAALTGAKPTYDAEVVRRWAKLSGLTVADSGRLSPTTIKKWRDAGSPGLAQAS